MLAMTIKGWIASPIAFLTIAMTEKEWVTMEPKG